MSKLFWVVSIFGFLFLQSETCRNDTDARTPELTHNYEGEIKDSARIEGLLLAKAFNRVSDLPTGFRVTHPKYFADFTSTGLNFQPLSNAPDFTWSLDLKEEEHVPPVHIGDKIVYQRDGYTEEYLLKTQTIEQLFVIPNPPKSESFTIKGVISSDGEFVKDKNVWAWKNEIGQVTLSNVYVYDALNRPIPAKMSATPNGSLIEILTIDLQEAIFPVTIDPVIGTNDFRISTFGTDGDLADQAFDPAISYSGTTNKYMVVWEGNSNGEIEIYGQLLNGDTGAPEGSTITISEATSGDATRDSTDPDIACSGDKFFVVWQSDDTYSFLSIAPLDNEFEIFGRIVNASNGTPEGSIIRISDMGSTDGSATFGAFSPAITYNATGNTGSPEYMVAWQGDDDAGSFIDEEFEIYVQRLSVSGVELGTNDNRISDMGPDGFLETQGFSPVIAWNSTDNKYMVAWRGDDIIVPLVDNEYEIFIQRLSSTGVEEGSSDFRLSFNGPNGDTDFEVRSPSLAYNSVNNTYLVAWYGDDNTGSLIDNEYEIYSVIVSNLGVPGTITRISDMGVDGFGNPDALLPKVSHDPYLNQFLVAWNGDDATGGLVDNEFEIYAQLLTGAGVESGADIRISDVGTDGDANRDGQRPHLIFNSSMREYLLVWDADDDVGILVDNENEIWGQRFAELDTEPTAQATSFSTSSVTSSSFTVNFTAASGTPDGYIAFRRSGASPTDVPVDHTAYEVDDVIGASTVAYVGSALTFDESGLSANTTYHYDIFSFNGVNSSTNYRTASPLQGNTTTHASEPTTQATSVIFSSQQTNALSVNFTDGNGASRLLVAREGAAVNAFPNDGNSYTANTVFGSGTNLGSSNYVVGAGSGPFTITSLSTATTYHFQVFEFNGSGGTENYNTSTGTGNPASISTLSTEPAAQATGYSASSVTISSFTVTFTAAAGTPDGYIALRKLGSSPTDVPTDGTIYSVNDVIGTSTVVHVGSGLTFDESSLSTNTTYHYDIFSFNGASTSINYRTASPLQGSTTTLTSEPTIQATSISFSALGINTVTVDFTDGNGASRLLVARAGSAVSNFPQDGNSYTASTVFASGSNLGSSTYVVGSGSGPFSITGLTTATEYNFRVFEFNGSGGLENYNQSTGTGNPSSIFTLSTEPTNQPTVLVLDNITVSSMDGSFTAATGSPDGYLVIRKAGSAPTGVPVDGTVYSMGDNLGDGTVAFTGSSTMFSNTSLAQGTAYHYKVFSFNGSGTTVNFRTISPLQGSASTTANQPTNQPTQLTFNAITSTSMDGSFTAATGSPTGYLVLRREGAAPTGTPTDGTIYTEADNIGDGTVIFNGSGTTFNSTTLSAETVYHYAVFAFNGTGLLVNFLPTSPLEGSATTLETEPTSQPTALSLNNFTTTSMDGSFVASASNPDGYLVLRKIGSSPTDTPVNGTSYAVNDNIGSSEVIFMGSGTSFTSDGLGAGLVYYYDVFAFNGSGATLNYLLPSPLENSAITISPAPEALDPAQIASTSFTANWNAATGATLYELDVSTDNFSTFVSGYDALEVTTGLEEAITGLSPNTSYKYRVRAVNASGVSANSLDKSVTTLEEAIGNPLQISNPVIEESGNDYEITISVSGGTGNYSVIVEYRGILSEDFDDQVELNPNESGDYIFTATASMLDELGLEFKITANDGVNAETSSGHFIYPSFNDEESSAISIERFGGTADSWQLFSIPFDVTDNLIETIFDELGPIKYKTDWRLMHWRNDQYVDFGEGINRIELGKGYWFNAKESVTVKIGAGQVNTQIPFTMSLVLGWNQIGNPYNITINWNNVLADNGDPVEVGQLQIFNGIIQSTGNVLAPFSGGFVFAGVATSLSIDPTTANGRYLQQPREKIRNHQLDQAEWILHLNLEANGIAERIGGVGMHPEASPLKDEYDQMALPRFVFYNDLYTTHEEYFYPWFSTDIVTTDQSWSWSFDLASNKTEGPSRLSWDHQAFGENQAQLVLLDKQTGQTIDMKATGSHVVDLGGKEFGFEIFYSVDAQIPLIPREALLGNAYPNPANAGTFIPLAVPTSNQSVPVRLSVLDINGKQVRLLLDEPMEPGFYQVEWDLTNDIFGTVGRGLYIYRVEIDGRVMQKKLIIE